MRRDQIVLLATLVACGGLEERGRAGLSGLAGAGGTDASASWPLNAGTGALPTAGSASTIPALDGGSSSGAPTLNGASAGSGLVTADGSPVVEPPRDCILSLLAAARNSQDPAAADSEPDDSAPETRAPSEAGAGGAPAVDLEVGVGDLSVLTIFDQSESMASPWDERSRWEVANDAWLKAIEGVLDNLTLATLFFPQPGQCAVAPLDSETQFDFQAGHDFYTRWIETASARAPAGSTPLELAFRMADQGIERACRLGLLSNRFRVVLVTDGQPTCGDDTNEILRLTVEWHAIGVETLVMGLPGSSAAATLLDAIAEAGGTGRHQSLGTPSQLDDGLHAAVR